jgi:2-oxoglutarate ferredoxin oxidoreductase subunit gamma
VIALGAVIGMTGVVSREAGEEAVVRRVPPAFKELNQKAFSLGYEKGKALVN